MMKEVMLLMGAGKIEMAIARRMGFGKKIIVGDKSKDNVKAVCKIIVIQERLLLKLIF